MGQTEDSGEHLCGVHRKGVGHNSILCVECLRWVHKRCSGIVRKLKSNVDFYCKRCLAGENGLFQSVLLKEVVIEPNVKLECVLKFCYLGDTIGVGGVEEEARARVRCAWAKFKDLLSCYDIPHKGKDIQGLCPECIGIWDWILGDEESKSAQHSTAKHRMMVRWMCGVSPYISPYICPLTSRPCHLHL